VGIKRRKTARARSTAKKRAVPAARKLKVIVVDDHPVIREQLAEIIGSEPDLLVCGEAATRAEALRMIGEKQPDLAVVDLTLPDARGIELIRDLHALSKDVKLLVLSMHEESMYGPRAIRAGAHGYIDKGKASSQVLAAIRKVLSGELYLSSELARQMASSLAGGSTLSTEPVDRLSALELEIFERLGEGQRIETIATDEKLSYKTIEAYRLRIRKKLGLPNAAALRRAAIIWASRHKFS
jgi:DNA-binding NarL/FixJ family response regulator